MCCSNFSIPTQYGQSWTIQNWAEDYLSFSSTKRVLHIPDYHQLEYRAEGMGRMWVSIENRETTWYGTTLKVLSYLTVILPLIALIFKCFLLCTHYKTAVDLTKPARSAEELEKLKSVLPKEKTNPLCLYNLAVLLDVAKKSEDTKPQQISFKPIYNIPENPTTIEELLKNSNIDFVNMYTNVDVTRVFEAKQVSEGEQFYLNQAVSFQKNGEGFVFLRSARKQGHWISDSTLSTPSAGGHQANAEILKVLSVFVSKEGNITDIQENGNPIPLDSLATFDWSPYNGH